MEVIKDTRCAAVTLSRDEVKEEEIKLEDITADVEYIQVECKIYKMILKNV